VFSRVITPIFLQMYLRCYFIELFNRGESPIMERFPNLGKCIISYQVVLRSVMKNVNN
jgi:hypothetical protein